MDDLAIILLCILGLIVLALLSWLYIRFVVSHMTDEDRKQMANNPEYADVFQFLGFLKENQRRN